MVDLQTVVGALRLEDDGLPGVEVRSSALPGLIDTLLSTLCGLANRPGGGLVLFGLDEALGYRAVELPDRRQTVADLAEAARAVAHQLGRSREGGALERHWIDQRNVSAGSSG